MGEAERAGSRVFREAGRRVQSTLDHALSNPNRHRQARLIMWDGLNQTTPFTPSKTERRPTRDGVRHAMGIPERHGLSADMVEIFPSGLVGTGRAAGAGRAWRDARLYLVRCRQRYLLDAAEDGSSYRPK
jgi:hypothetical protein